MIAINFSLLHKMASLTLTLSFDFVSRRDSLQLQSVWLLCTYSVLQNIIINLRTLQYWFEGTCAQSYHLPSITSKGFCEMNDKISLQRKVGQYLNDLPLKKGRLLMWKLFRSTFEEELFDQTQHILMMLA